MSSGAGRRRAPPPDDSRALEGAGSGILEGLAARSAQRVEFAQCFGLLAGRDVFGEKSSGYRAMRKSPPHAVAAGDVDPLATPPPIRDRPSGVIGRGPTQMSSRSAQRTPSNKGLAEETMASTRAGMAGSYGSRNSMVPETRNAPW